MYESGTAAYVRDRRFIITSAVTGAISIIHKQLSIVDDKCQGLVVECNNLSCQGSLCMCICHVRTRMSPPAFCSRYLEHVSHANSDNLLVCMWNMSTALYLAIGYVHFKYSTFSTNIATMRGGHLLLLPRARFQSLSTSVAIKIARPIKAKRDLQHFDHFNLKLFLIT